MLAAIWWGQRAWWRNHVEITFVAEGVEPGALELTFFPDQFAFAQPSPPPPHGSVTWRGGALVVGRDLVPGSGVMRYAGPAVGTGCVHLQLGATPPPIRLRAPRELRGRIGEPIGTWCFGWRCLGMRPVAGAEVVVMAGGEHGIDIASASTDAEGRFTIVGIDRERDGLALRVRAPGFAIVHQPLDAESSRDGVAVEQPVVAIARGEACHGVVVLPPGLDPTTLRVLARGLPGVDARVAADGTFTLVHLPGNVEPRLLLHGLPPTLAQLPARATRGAPVRIEVVAGAAVRGRVLELASQRPLVGALVFCGDDGDAVRTDADGNFELRQLLPGDIEITAQYEVVDARRRRTRLLGSRRLQLAKGAVVDGVDLVVSN